MQRNHMSAEDAQSRVDAQWDIERKRALANYVIDNGGEVKETQHQVDILLPQLLPPTWVTMAWWLVWVWPAAWLYVALVALTLAVRWRGRHRRVSPAAAKRSADAAAAAAAAGASRKQE